MCIPNFQTFEVCLYSPVIICRYFVLTYFVFQEVKNILQHAIERNMIRRALGAKRQAFESWRQVVETSFAICQLDVFPGESRETVILDLIHETLNKVRFLFFFCCNLFKHGCLVSP